jgi:hypothetical protein
MGSEARGKRERRVTPWEGGELLVLCGRLKVAKRTVCVARLCLSCGDANGEGGCRPTLRTSSALILWSSESPFALSTNGSGSSPPTPAAKSKLVDLV